MRRKWSEFDCSTARKMAAERATNAEIAGVLGRRADAVRAWLHHDRRKWHEPAPIEHPRVAIAKNEVVRWYLAGWRFAGFDGDLCVFEWLSSGKAPYHPRKNVSVDSGDIRAISRERRDLALAFETEPA